MWFFLPMKHNHVQGYVVTGQCPSGREAEGTIHPLDSVPQIYSGAEFASCKYLSSELRDPYWVQVFIYSLSGIYFLPTVCQTLCWAPATKDNSQYPAPRKLHSRRVLPLPWSPPSFLPQWQCFVAPIPSKDGRGEDLLRLLLK